MPRPNTAGVEDDMELSVETWYDDGSFLRFALVEDSAPTLVHSGYL